jgi:hypothetical protein
MKPLLFAILVLALLCVYWCNVRHTDVRSRHTAKIECMYGAHLLIIDRGERNYYAWDGQKYVLMWRRKA